MRLSTVLKNMPLTLETSDGDIELVISKFTILDAERRQQLTNSVFDDKNATELDKYNAFQLARIMTSVKYPDSGEYFWPGTISEFKSLDYEMEFINALSAAVSEVNPIPELVTDDDGKSQNSITSKKKRS